MAHKIGRKLASRRPVPLPPGQSDILPVNPQPAPSGGGFGGPTFSPQPSFNEINSIGKAMPSGGGFGGPTFSPQPQAQPLPQQGMPCPDPSAHTQAPAQNDNLSYMQPMPKMGGFMGAIGSSLGKALVGQQRPSMMPNGYLGNPAPRPTPRFPFMGIGGGFF